MIHVCFGLYDKDGNYSKYVGAAIGSLLENTQQDICIHLLHDSTLSKENKDKFKILVRHYWQHIYFYPIDFDKKLNQMSALKKFTIGTLFRLKIVEVLPAYINKAIYLDADIIVNMDIKELWEKEFKGKALLARKDAKGIRNLCERGVLSYSAYINAGVLLLNLEKIRNQYAFFQDAMNFLRKYPESDFLDQDAINYMFKNDLDFIEEKYNVFTATIRNSKFVDKKVIYHFAGDHPRDPGVFFADKLFLKYILKTPWGLTHCKERFKQKDSQIQWIRNFMKKVSGDCKKIFFGTSGKIHQSIMAHFTLNECDYYIDNDPALWGKKKQKAIIHSPEVLIREDKVSSVIIVTMLRYAEIKLQLESYGYRENEQFFDGRKLLLEFEDGYL